MKQSIPWWYYASLAILFCVFKALYAQASSADLRVLLAPTNYLVELILGSTAVFDPAAGFVHSTLRISIDKSCSGFNFWVLCWLMLSMATMQRRFRWPVLLVLPIVSYVLTLLINTSRILTAIFLRGVLPPAVQQYAWLHQTEGALLYLFSLVLIYLGFISICSYFQARYAQPA